MKRQHILLVLASLGPGGAERTATALANSWHKRSHRVTLLTLQDQPPFFDLDPNIRHITLGIRWQPGGPGRNLRAHGAAILRLRRAVRKANPDVVISFIHVTNIRVLCATIGLGIPVIVSERTDPAPHTLSAPWRRLRRLMYPRATAHVFQSRDASDHFDYLPSERRRVIPNPVIRPPTHLDPGVVQPQPCIMAVGRLVVAKGFDLLIGALCAVFDDHNAWHLVIAGEGAERKRLQQLADAHPARTHIHLPGLVRRPGLLQLQASIVAQPSRWEGFPNALAEAMSLGRPVIATDIPGATRDLVTHNVSGWLVPPDDRDALARALRQLMQSPETRTRLGTAASASVRQFGIETIAAQWEAVIDAAGAPR